MNDLDPEQVSDARVLSEQPAGPAAKNADTAAPLPPRRPTVRLMLSSPLHLLSFGFGSGLSPVAPGTVGTLWAWGAFLVLDMWLSSAQWAAVLLIGLAAGWWACTRTAQALRTADPGSVVWDEILAFWLILWVITPCSGWWQLAAFLAFRLFDAAKPGPVGWADRLYKLKPGGTPGWPQGWGILFDDLVAALCTLIVLALWKV
jgi:phosphatidylglycerophosphatase A